jgi:hypothetical protein
MFLTAEHGLPSLTIEVARYALRLTGYALPLLEVGDLLDPEEEPDLVVSIIFLAK